jgi:hypothetical protein
MDGCPTDAENQVCGEKAHEILDEMKPDCCKSSTGCADNLEMEVCAMQELP